MYPWALVLKPEVHRSTQVYRFHYLSHQPPWLKNRNLRIYLPLALKKSSVSRAHYLLPRNPVSGHIDPEPQLKRPFSGPLNTSLYSVEY